MNVKLMQRGVYIGEREDLRSENALVMPNGPGSVLVQFDNLTCAIDPSRKLTKEEALLLGPTVSLAFSWHPFPEKDFEIVPEPNSEDYSAASTSI